MGTQYGDYTFALKCGPNLDKIIYCTPLIDTCIVLQRDYPDVTTYPGALWEILRNNVSGEEGYGYYSIRNCTYGQYLTATVNPNKESELWIASTSIGLQSGSWWSGLVSPFRLMCPILTNILVDAGNGNGTVEYISIKSEAEDGITLTDITDDSTNLYQVYGSSTNIPNGISLLWSGGEDLQGSSSMKYNSVSDDQVYSSPYTPEEVGFVWSVLPYRYQMYTIQTDDGRFLVRKTSQTVGLANIIDSLNLHSEALWNLLDSYDNYVEDAIKTAFHFPVSGVLKTYMDGNPHSNDMYSTPGSDGTMAGANCIIEPIPTGMPRRPKHLGISFRKFGKSIIHAFDKTKQVIVKDADYVEQKGTVAFASPGDIINPGANEWSMTQRGIGIFSQQFNPGDTYDPWVLRLIEGVFQAIKEEYDYIVGGRHLLEITAVSSHDIHKAIDSYTRAGSRAGTTYYPTFYSSNDTLKTTNTEKGSGDSTSASYMVTSLATIKTLNTIAQTGLDNNSLNYVSELYDCDCFSTALNAQAYIWFVEQPGTASLYGPAVGIFVCTVVGGAHAANFYMDENKQLKLFEPQNGMLTTTRKMKLIQYGWFGL